MIPRPLKYSPTIPPSTALTIDEFLGQRSLLVEQDERDEFARRGADPCRLDGRRDGNQREQDQEPHHHGAHRDRLEQLRDRDEQRHIRSLQPRESGCREEAFAASGGQRLGWRAGRFGEDPLDVGPSLDPQQLATERDRDQQGGQDEKEQQDQTELEPAHRVSRLPDLRRKQQEHDEDQQDGQRPRDQLNDMGDLLPEPLERPGADLDEPESDDA